MSSVIVYASNAASGVVYISSISNVSEFSGSRMFPSVQITGATTFKLEDVLPTAKAMATEVKGGTKEFMRWLDSP